MRVIIVAMILMAGVGLWHIFSPEKYNNDVPYQKGFYTDSFQDALAFCDKMQNPDYIPDFLDKYGVYKQLKETGEVRNPRARIFY